jgi:hypothetical protein
MPTLTRISRSPAGSVRFRASGISGDESMMASPDEKLLQLPLPRHC